MVDGQRRETDGGRCGSGGGGGGLFHIAISVV